MISYRTIFTRSLFLVALVCSYMGYPVKAAFGDQTQGSNFLSPGFELEPPNQITCYVLLEPLSPGRLVSKVLNIECSNSPGQLHPGSEISTSYFIASFYDKTDFSELLIQYYGPAMCSTTTSYGIGQLPASFDNRFSSGSGYSGCNYIYVYDLANYAGDSASCFANCSSFDSLNDRVSSWRLTN